MKKGRVFMKRKRLLSAALTGVLAFTMLSGCASAGPSQGATETTQSSAQETDRTNGTVKLKVWAEESTYEALN